MVLIGEGDIEDAASIGVENTYFIINKRYNVIIYTL